MKNFMFIKLLFIASLPLLLCGVVIDGMYESPSAIKKTKRTKNVILLIGDGMGYSQMQSAYITKGSNLNMYRCKKTGFVKTNSDSHLITDSGAAATALGTGKKTTNGKIGVNSEDIPQKNIVEYAEEHGLSTGVVATAYVTHATPAGFYAHNISRHNYEEIAFDIFRNDVDVFIGGGRDHFNNRKTDSLNLIDSLIYRGYNVIYDINDFNKVTSGKLAGLLYPEHPYKVNEGRGDMLTRSAMKAIDILSTNRKGYFLMVESSQIDWAGHNGNQKYSNNETIDFDEMVGAVLDYAEKDGETLVIITADHETGGMTITGGNLAGKRVVSNYSTKGHSAGLVPIFTYGPGADEFTGFIDNTDIFYKIKSLLDLK